MPTSELSETGQRFMIQLFEQTRDDQSVQVSMYYIGSLLGLERDAASRVAEELIGLQMIEIKTLAGGIGISATGSEGRAAETTSSAATGWGAELPQPDRENGTSTTQSRYTITNAPPPF